MYPKVSIHYITTIRDYDEAHQLKSFPFDKLIRQKTLYISLGSISGAQKHMYDLFIAAFDHLYFENWNIVMNCWDTKYLDK